MSALSHRRLRQEIDAFVDGELPAVRVGALQLHLRRCRECAAAVELTHRIQAALERRAVADPSPLAVARLRRQFLG